MACGLMTEQQGAMRPSGSFNSIRGLLILLRTMMEVIR